MASRGEGAGLLGVRLGIGQRVVSNCIVHHLFVHIISSSTIIIVIIVIIILLLLFSCLIKLSLSQLTGFTFHFSPPSQRGRGEGERTAAWCLAAGRVKPQQRGSGAGAYTEILGFSTMGQFTQHLVWWP